MDRRSFLGAVTSAAAAGLAGPGLAHQQAARTAAVSPRPPSSPRYRPPHRFGLGGVPLAGGFKWTSNEDAQAALRTAWDGGVRYFDTSPWYGQGRSERRMGQFLAEKPRDEYVLSTKIGRLLHAGAPVKSGVWPEPAPFHREYDYSASGARRSIEDSLQRLGVDRIDMVFIHDLSPDNKDMGENWTSYFKQALSGAMPELIRMREEGMIKGWGLGVGSSEPLYRTLEQSDPDVFLSAAQYTLIKNEESLARLQPACAAKGVSLVIGSALNVGFLSGTERYDYLAPITAEVRQKRFRLTQVAERYGVDLRTAALRFCDAPEVVSAVLVGARNGEQMQQDIDSMSTPIPPEFWAELKRERLIPKNAPEPVARAA